MRSAVAEMCYEYLNMIVSVDVRVNSIEEFIAWSELNDWANTGLINARLSTVPTRLLAEIYCDPVAHGYVDPEPDNTIIRNEILRTLRLIKQEVENGQIEPLPEIDFGDAHDWNPFAPRI